MKISTFFFGTFLSPSSEVEGREIEAVRKEDEDDEIEVEVQQSLGVCRSNRKVPSS